jgi:hypothetical protein
VPRLDWGGAPHKQQVSGNRANDSSDIHRGRSFAHM